MRKSIRRKGLSIGNKSRYIQFTDADRETICVTAFDTSGNGKLSKKEAKGVTMTNLFKNNTTLTEFPEIVYFVGAKLGGYTFYGCTSLKTIDLRNIGALSGNENFTNCKKLTDIYLNTSTDIPCNQQFNNTNSLKNIHLYGSLKEYFSKYLSWETYVKNVPGYYVKSSIYLNDELLQEITIPEGVTSIGRYAFYNKTITKVLNGANLTAIKTFALAYSDIESIDNMDNITSLEEYAFQYATKFNMSKIPDGITNVPNCCFMGCTGLTSVDRNNMTSTSTGAFSGCTNLEMTIDEWGNTFNAQAFYNCPKVAVTDSVLAGIKNLGNGALNKAIISNEVYFRDLVWSQGAFSADLSATKTLRGVVVGNKAVQVNLIPWSYAEYVIFEDGGTATATLNNDRGFDVMYNAMPYTYRLVDFPSNATTAHNPRTDGFTVTNIVFIFRSSELNTFNSTEFLQFSQVPLGIYIFVYPDMVDTYKNSDYWGKAGSEGTRTWESQADKIHAIGDETWVSVMKAIASYKGLTFPDDYDWTDEFVDYDIYGGHKPEKDDYGVYKTKYHNNLDS